MRKHRSSLLLMELILVLFFFLLTASACLQILARARNASREARQLSRGQTLAVSAAEHFLAADGKIAALGNAFPEGQLTGGDFVLLLDEDLNPCSSGQAVFTLQVTPDPEAEGSALVRILASDGELFSLPVRCPIPERRH